MKKINLFFERLKYLNFLILLFPYQLFAQIEVKGVVVDADSKEPLCGIVIIEMNTDNIVISSVTGRFKIIVSDSSMIKATFLGYHDYVIEALKFNNDTIKLVQDTTFFIEEEPYILLKTYSLSYFGDFEYLPYGLAVHYFHPYLFGKSILLSGNLHYKTDFNSNFDIKFTLERYHILKFEKYCLTALVSFQKRILENVDIIDYNFVLDNSVLNSTISLGAGLKQDYSNNYYTEDYGLIVGFKTYSPDNLTYIDGSFTLYSGYSEYSLTVLQKLSRNKRFLENLSLGVNYRAYKNYDEFNLILKYFDSFF